DFLLPFPPTLRLPSFEKLFRRLPSGDSTSDDNPFLPVTLSKSSQPHKAIFKPISPKIREFQILLSRSKFSFV
ncbi:hypothetical protein LINGRAHAP2_LOCUS13655, partial [Linum grandiflorum]